MLTLNEYSVKWSVNFSRCKVRRKERAVTESTKTSSSVVSLVGAV